MSRPTSAVIALDQVHKHYETGGRRVQALDGVDLQIRRGELVAIVGPSGSGKSTLLDVMGALHRPSSGRVQVAGVDIAGLDDRGLASLRAHRIGFVFQQFHLLDGMTSVQNVAAGLIYRGLPARERTRRALRALAQVDLADRAHHRPDQLSGGESQRVAVARALVGAPDILLADEPTGNLDTATGQRIVDLFTRLNGAGATIVVITHDRDLAARLPRRVDLRDGRIVADSSPDGTPATAAPLTEVGP